jgi:hypothetical protein
MTNNIIYHTDKTIISEQKMQFNITNHRPTYPAKENETIKAEIEKQLFEVFSKYCAS